MTRRFSLLSALAALVVLALGGGLAWGIVRDGPPADQRDLPPGPVLLVPGYGGSLRSLAPLKAFVREQGREPVVVRLPGQGTGDLRESAQALGDVARAQLARGAGSVDVVGYSAGGVVARLWVRELGGGEMARRVVTIGSPHRGAEVAALGALLGDEEVCPAACRALVPGSELLTSLAGQLDVGPEWVSLWSQTDGFVTPAESGRLEGAVDVRLQDVCSGSTAQHGELPGDPLVLGLVARALGEGLDKAPAPSECAALTA